MSESLSEQELDALQDRLRGPTFDGGVSRQVAADAIEGLRATWIPGACGGGRVAGMGCGQPFESVDQVYRCGSCDQPFHKICLTEVHFSKGWRELLPWEREKWAKAEAEVKEKEAALREIFRECQRDDRYDDKTVKVVHQIAKAALTAKDDEV